MSNSKTLNWNDRFALMDHYTPSDADACSAFGVTQTELDTARDMRAAGAFTATPDVDVKSYQNMFAAKSVTTATASKKSASKSSTTTSKKSGSTSVTKTKTTTAKPETATKKPKELKKRGRKGDRIAKAFAAIPATPVPVDKFASDNNVSLAVLRQSKRFDKSPEMGNVHVKKDKTSGSLMIWREKA